jgi:trimethylguanosine synthase
MKEKELPDGDCGDGIKNPFSKDEVPNKYWAQRKRLFSKYDDGIQLDKESWYSVTPEAIATHIARRISAMTKDDGKKKVILDAFCGVGGNGIAFALHEDVSLVLCVDTDRNKLEMAANNASKYGVDPSKLLFVEGDAIEVLKMYSNGSNTSTTIEANCDKNIESCHGYTIAGYQKLPPNIDCVFLSPPWGGVEVSVFLR